MKPKFLGNQPTTESYKTIVIQYFSRGQKSKEKLESFVKEIASNENNYDDCLMKKKLLIKWDL